MTDEYCEFVSIGQEFDIQISYSDKVMRYIKIKGEPEVRTEMTVIRNGETHVLKGLYVESDVNEQTVKMKVKEFNSLDKLLEHVKTDIK